MRHPSMAIAMVLCLLIAPLAFGQEAGEFRKQLDAIVKAHEAARQRYHKALEGKPTADEQKLAIERYVVDVFQDSNQALDLVKASPKDPAVVEALDFVIKIARGGPGDQSYRAMEILLRDHPRDRGMGAICSSISYFSHSLVAESLIRSVLAYNPARDDRGEACFALAGYLQSKARMVRAVREDRKKIERYVNIRFRDEALRMIEKADLAALDRESESLLERVISEFADVKSGPDPRPLGAIADGELFARRNLAIGKVAPDIQGQDHEGQTFALGDSRGKVVVLTFSGNWCGPCVAMYPDERDLVAKLKDQPFALVSVNTDAKVETLHKSIASGDVTWRCWWDGGTDGPITTRWGISGFPTVFVLDKAGVIRFKDIRGQELKRAVEELMAESPAVRDSR